MPAGNVRGAVAAATFPTTLSTKFTEAHAVLANINEYHDGTTQRASLVSAGRRTWSLSKRLTIGNMLTLRAFWEANQNTAFNFYNPFETSPLFAPNPSGSAGLYLVRFASDWDENINPVRSDVPVQLIQVADDADIAAARLNILNPNPGTAAVGTVTLSVITASTISEDYAADASIGPTDPNLLIGFSLPYIFSSAGWSSRTDTIDLDISSFDPGTLSLYFGVIGSLSGSGENDLDVYDASIRILYQDGTAVTLRPHAASASLANGTVTNPANAIDGDPATFARVQRLTFAGAAESSLLILSGWTSA